MSRRRDARAGARQACCLVTRGRMARCRGGRPPPAAAGGAGTRERGYTLLEIIIAFAVLGLALVLLLGTLSGGLRQVRGSADSARAALHARSLLDVVGVGEPLEPGRREGGFDAGRYRWVLEVEPYADPVHGPDAPVDPYGPRLMHLRLQVQWGEGGPRERLRLETLRLVQPDPAGVAG